MNQESGINSIQVTTLVKKIGTNLEVMEKRFAELNRLFDTSTKYFDTPTGDEFRKKYNLLKQNYEVVHQNFLTYISDFEKLNKVYGQAQDKAVLTFK